MKDTTIYNTLKGRLETVSFEFTKENTTWFDGLEDYCIYRIADAFGGLLVQETGYTYPILIGDVSRSGIGNNQQKALELLKQTTLSNSIKMVAENHISSLFSNINR